MTCFWIIKVSIFGFLMFATSIYIFWFPKIYINFLPSLMMVYPAFFVIMLFPMFNEYIYLFSRNLTEKEKVSRDSYWNQRQLEDEIDKITFKEAVRNIYRRLTSKTQKSLLTISWEIEDERISKGLELHDISELQDQI